MLNLNQAGGASDAVNCNLWLASMHAMSMSSGPENRPLKFGYPSEPTLEESFEEQEDDSFEWAAEHFSELLKTHKGEWVLIRDHRVLDSSRDSTALLSRAVARGIKNPLMLWVETPPKAGMDAFITYAC